MTIRPSRSQSFEGGHVCENLACNRRGTCREFDARACCRGWQTDGRWQVFLEELQNLLLPVELISFTISSDENNAILEWTTQTESNNEGFEIELFDGQQFQKIGFQKGEGNSVKKVVPDLIFFQ